MSYMKKLLAAVLILAMTLGLVVAGYAATSPSGGDVNPDYNPKTKETTTAIDGLVIRYRIQTESDTARFVKVIQNDSNVKTLEISGSKDGKNQAVDTSKIGDGKKGILNSKAGRKIKTVVVKSTKNVIVFGKAFKGSKVSKIKFDNRKTQIDTGAFKGTQQKKVTIQFTAAKKAKDIKVAYGAFEGLSKDSKIIVSTTMSKAQFAKLEKKLRDAGFEGKIVRK